MATGKRQCHSWKTSLPVSSWTSYSWALGKGSSRTPRANVTLPTSGAGPDLGQVAATGVRFCQERSLRARSLAGGRELTHHAVLLPNPHLGPPVNRSTAVRELGLPTRMQADHLPSDSRDIAQSTRATSWATGLSQSTLPSAPDTAAMKAQGEETPEWRDHSLQSAGQLALFMPSLQPWLGPAAFVSGS